MKIILINPPQKSGPKVIREGRCEQRLSSFQYVMVPISLPSIAGLLLKNRHQVKIFDFIVEDYDYEEAIELIAKLHPDLALFNFSTLTYQNDRDFVHRLKEKLPKSHFTAIGVHVTALPERTLKEVALDSVIKGEPEVTCLKLAEALSKKQSLKSIKGLSYKEKDKINHNQPREVIMDLDELPFPARDLLKNDRYLMPVQNRPYTLIVTARGCPNQCIFCTARLYYGNKLRVRKPEKVIQEIEEIIQKYEIKDFMMWADTFTLDKDFVFDFCRLVREKNLDIHWMCNARVNSVDLNLLSAMKRAGCIGIAYGVESADQKILNRIKKGTKVSEIKRAFELTREAGIESLAHVIFGLPGENRETIKKTVKFIKEINPDYAQFYCAVPFPGTEFHRLAEKSGWIKTYDWNRYEINRAVIATHRLSQKELAKARSRAIMGFYIRKTFIFRELSKIKSVGQFFNLCQKGLSFLKNWG